MSKKKLLSLALVVIMIAILSFSTLAWFQAQDKVTNDFKISDSLSDFEVDVWEEVSGEGGEAKEVGRGTQEETDGETFNNVVPNKEYLKTVHVENTSNNDLAGQYIKVEVTFTNYNVLTEMGDTETGYDCTGMLIGANFSDDKENTEVDWWYDAEDVVVDEDNHTATYKFYLRSVLENGDDVVLFESVKLPESMDINDAAALQDEGFQIKVVAYAIQSANIADPEGETDLDNVVYAFSSVYVENA